MLDRRLHMVNGQLRTGGIVDKSLLAAFLATPRQRFVTPEFKSLAYLDRELPARGGAKRKLLTPVTLARMLQAAAVVPGDRALDVAGGSGYCAALLDAMGAKVVMLESDFGRSRRRANRTQGPGERRRGRGFSRTGRGRSRAVRSCCCRGRVRGVPGQPTGAPRRSGSARRH